MQSRKAVEAHLSVSILANGNISRILMQRPVHQENAVVADATEMAFNVEQTISKSQYRENRVLEGKR